MEDVREKIAAARRENEVFLQHLEQLARPHSTPPRQEWEWTLGELERWREKNSEVYKGPAQGSQDYEATALKVYTREVSRKGEKAAPIGGSKRKREPSRPQQETIASDSARKLNVQLSMENDSFVRKIVKNSSRHP